METNVQIILIIAVGILMLAALYFNRGRLKRLIFKAGEVEAQAEMVDNSDDSKRQVSPTTKTTTADVKRIEQDGDEHELGIKADDVTASDVKQRGKRNKIQIG